MRDIGKNIRQLRVERKMTQDDLAEKLFVTRQTVSNYETGKSRPDIDMLVKIGEVLESDIQTVLYGPQPKKRNPEVRRLMFSGVATALLGIVLAVIKPTAQEYARNTYRFGILSQLTMILEPLFYLLLGWSAAQALGTALKKKPLAWKAAKWTGSILVVLLAVWFAMMAISLWIYPMDWIHRAYYAVFRFQYWLSIPNNTIYLLPGAALWLCGFPGVLRPKRGENHA